MPAVCSISSTTASFDLYRQLPLTIAHQDDSSSHQVSSSPYHTPPIADPFPNKNVRLITN